MPIGDDVYYFPSDVLLFSQSLSPFFDVSSRYHFLRMHGSAMEVRR